MDDQGNPVNWFEIPVVDLERAKSFYESSFGFKLTVVQMGSSDMAWFPMAEGAGGATGALIKSEGYSPSHSGTIIYLSVADIEETLAKISANGGKTLLPKTGIGEYGFIAQFEDTEGNRVAVHSVK